MIFSRADLITTQCVNLRDDGAACPEDTLEGNAWCKSGYCKKDREEELNGKKAYKCDRVDNAGIGMSVDQFFYGSRKI